MKKTAYILSAVFIVALCAAIFVGCAPVGAQAEFKEPDLARDAEISTDGGVTYVKFGEKTTFDTVVLREKADKTTLFKMYFKTGDSFETFYEQDRIDKYRVCAFPEISTEEIKIEIVSASGKTKIDSVEVYNVRPKQKSFRVSDYITTDGQKVRQLKNDPAFTGYFNVVTDLILIGEISLDDNAEIKYGEGEEDFAADMEALREAIGENRVKIFCSVGIRKSDNAATMDFINGNIDKIVKTLYDFCEKYGLAGIDFDWEYPENSKQWKAYDMLISRVSDVLNPVNRGVTVAVASWGIHFSKKTVEKIDFINLMTYDMFDERGDHASIYETGSKAVKAAEKFGVPREKIFLGLSFYGRTTDGSSYAWPDFRWDYAENGKSLGQWGNKIPNYAYKDKDGNAKTCDAYINGFAMNRDKTAYAIAANLGGVMIFRMKCDAPYTYEFSLHRAVEEAIVQRIDADYIV